MADALALEQLGRTFETVLDCGLFHTLDADERVGYAAGLASVTEAGGTLYLLCFADEGDGEPGPHPVRRDDLTAAFGAGSGWDVVDISPDPVHTRFHDDAGAPAWLATVRRQEEIPDDRGRSAS